MQHREYELLDYYFGDCVKTIPLPTKYVYTIDKFGNVFRGGRKLKGYIHYSKPPYDKHYKRYTLTMKDGSVKKFYGHRLMGFAFLGLKEGDGKIVCHDGVDGTNNYVETLRLGTKLENQTIDRLEAGTYFNRGPRKEVQTEQHPF